MPDLGSQPIELQYKQMMEDLARSLDHFFNGNLKGSARPTGFVLMVFPFGSKDGRCNYLSNGADRADVVKLMRDQANRMDESTQ